MVDVITNYYQRIKAKRITSIAIACVFAISVVGTIGFGPQVMALVEPHITINMDPAQTTEPFQIKDDLGSEVFSINSDATISSANYADLVFKQESVVNVDGPAGDTVSNPLFLAKWQLTKQAGTTDSFKILPSTTLYGTGLRSSGTNAVVCEGFTSTDGINWNDFTPRISFQNSQFTNDADSASGIFMDEDELFFAIACYGGNAVGTIKEITFNGRIDLPLGYSIERIL